MSKPNVFERNVAESLKKPSKAVARKSGTSFELSLAEHTGRADPYAAAVAPFLAGLSEPAY